MRHRWPLGIVLALAVPLSSAGCGSVSVRRSRHEERTASRPASCTVEFLRNAPERAYDELGELYSYFPWVVEPQDVLREKACELGADAVIVTRDFVISTERGPDRKLVAGIAIKYRDSTSECSVGRGDLSRSGRADGRREGYGPLVPCASGVTMTIRHRARHRSG